MTDPRIILLLSGKRKSGKDYIAGILHQRYSDICTVVRISEPLKSIYAKENNLDIKELLGNGPYKEHYRKAMIEWSDEIRSKEAGYFCKAAAENASKTKLWIVSDIRRKTDVKWFKESYKDKIYTIRVESDLNVRKSRGWIFTSGVDDVKSECDLDDFEDWDLRIRNNSAEDLSTYLEEIQVLIDRHLDK